ncbi:MAG: hypothetical protein KVP17_003009 [Porospora cf. gigantea B]|uniref:uncharacterized protein n=1 Tax=Porospora cf. gigantea B TaxID=2853592 RepID=UPI003571B3A1|nr:MAG: hypothetical protein KVP17_003009 [Porospora cf. gigantea B]
MIVEHCDTKGCMPLLVASMMSLTDNSEDSDVQYALGEGVAKIFDPKTPLTSASPLSSPTSTTGGYTNVTMEDEPTDEVKKLYRCHFCAAVNPARASYTLRRAIVLSHMRTCANATEFLIDSADFTVSQDAGSVLHVEECTEGQTVSQSSGGDKVLVQVYQCNACDTICSDFPSIKGHLATHSPAVRGQKITAPAQFWDTNGYPVNIPCFVPQKVDRSEIDNLSIPPSRGGTHTQQMLNRLAVTPSQMSRVRNSAHGRLNADEVRKLVPRHLQGPYVLGSVQDPYPSKMLQPSLYKMLRTTPPTFEPSTRQHLQSTSEPSLHELLRKTPPTPEPSTHQHLQSTPLTSEPSTPQHLQSTPLTSEPSLYKRLPVSEPSTDEDLSLFQLIEEAKTLYKPAPVIRPSANLHALVILRAARIPHPTADLLVLRAARISHPRADLVVVR